jgi:alpha-beta hydrolase superfamily lysophospholipase
MPAPLISSLVAGDGTLLHVADWIADGVGDAGAVVIMHGLGEHCGRYVHVARFFNQLGYAVRTYDHRGHGRSGGARGDVPDNDSLLRDAKLVLDDFAARHASAARPPLLFGHSMGALFAARFATAKLSPLRGLILSSPPLSIPLKLPHRIMLGILSAVAPGLGIDNGLKVDYLSHDPGVVEAYRNDPLVHPKISARLLSSMLAAVEHVQAHAGTLSIPVLLVYAGADRIVDARGSEQFASRLPAAMRTVHRYPDFFHENFNEPDAGLVFADVKRWLDQQFSASGVAVDA